jgi:hypothetical protein
MLCSKIYVLFSSYSLSTEIYFLRLFLSVLNEVSVSWDCCLFRSSYFWRFFLEVFSAFSSLARSITVRLILSIYSLSFLSRSRTPLSESFLELFCSKSIMYPLNSVFSLILESTYCLSLSFYSHLTS